jgi:hypothetical protein
MKSMYRRTFLTMAIPAAFAASSDKRVPLTTSMRLSFTGLGPVRIGMTAAGVRDALSGRIKTEKLDLGTDCYYLNPSVPGIGFMILSSRVARVDVFTGPWRTVSGAAIGTSEEKIKELYGDLLTIERHKYVDYGRYLIIRPKHPVYKGYEMRFETDGKVVTTFRAGLAEAVALVEGCA